MTKTKLPTTPVDSRKIKSYTDSRSLGVVLFKQSDIQAITDRTGKLASANEYQVHYHFLNGRSTFPDGSYIDIAIPTCYFNYKQEVSTGSVDFHLSDVDTMSDALQPIANAKANILLNSELADNINAMFPGATFEWINVNLGTIHKHPGNLSTFSGTDLATSIADPGICFPLGVIEKDFYKPSFSSILLHKSGRTVIARTEYRLATQKDETVEYYKGRCISLIADGTSTPSQVESLLGVKPVDNSYTMLDNVTTIPNVISALNNMLRDMDYNASTDFIKEDNVSLLAPVTTHGTYYNYNYSSTAKVPQPHTAEYKEVEAHLKLFDKIELIQWPELMKMTNTMALKHLNTLEEFFAINPVKHTKYVGTTNSTIIQLQKDIWTEAKTDMELEATRANSLATSQNPNPYLYAELTRHEMEDDLKEWGLMPADFDKLPDDELLEMHAYIDAS